MAGDQEPWMPLVDVVGRAGMLLPAQYGPKVPKDGFVAGVIVIVRVTLDAHCPALGVNV
jgi:hypothetical protein